MTLNSKIGLSLVLPMLFGVGLLGWLIHAQLISRFSQLEAAELKQQHERLEQAIAAEFDSLQRLTSDWGEYDETYDYMAGENPEFVAANITPAGMQNLQLDAIAMLNPDHSIHEGFSLTTEGDALRPLPDGLAAAISRAASLLPDPDQGFGVVTEGERVLSVAVSGILTSEGEGPSRGQIVMARYLTDGTVEQLAKRIRSRIQFEPMRTEHALGLQLRQRLANEPYVQHELSSDHIASYSLLNGLDGKPALVMQVSMRRDILHEGQSAVSTLLTLAALGYLILLLAMFSAVRWVAIRRIQRVARELQSIDTDSDVEQRRITVSGNDEISALSNAINHLLQRLLDSFRERHRLNERQRKLNALLVQIATDETLAGCDAQTLCQVLQGPFNREIGLEHWSLWLREPGKTFNCLSECEPRQGDSTRLAAVLDGVERWPAGSEPLELAAELAAVRRLGFGFSIEGQQGALVVDQRDESDAAKVDAHHERYLGEESLHEENRAFLIAATQLIERSLNNHFQRQREDELRKQSEVDPLTQLANRSKFELELLRALRNLGRLENLAILFIDLDRFKPINDVHGHVVGDAVLREVAGRLRSSVRDADLVARLGGDEFIVLLRSVRDERAVIRVAEKMRASLEPPVDLADVGPLSIGCSIGGALAPRHGLSVEALIHAADLAMYQAKADPVRGFAMAGETAPGLKAVDPAVGP